MKTFWSLIFILLLVVNLASFALLIRHSLRWRTLRAHGLTHTPFGLYLVQSPLFPLMIGTMSIAFGMSGAPNFAGNPALWPWRMPWWTGVLYGVAVLLLGALLAMRSKRSPQEEQFDERTEAVSLRADKATLWALYLYLFGRGIWAVGEALGDQPVDLLHLLAASPWFQSVGFLLLIHLAARGYFNRRMS